MGVGTKMNRWNLDFKGKVKVLNDPESNDIQPHVEAHRCEH
jgi:hypothetical protein